MRDEDYKVDKEEFFFGNIIIIICSISAIIVCVAIIIDQYNKCKRNQREAQRYNNNDDRQENGADHNYGYSNSRSSDARNSSILQRNLRILFPNSERRSSFDGSQVQMNSIQEGRIAESSQNSVIGRLEIAFKISF